MNINLEKWAIGICLVFLLALGFKTAKADCTGCGDDGHQVCPIEEKHKHITVMTEEHKTSSSTPEDGVVFAVCIFAVAEDGTSSWQNSTGDTIKNKSVTFDNSVEISPIENCLRNDFDETVHNNTLNSQTSSSN